MKLLNLSKLSNHIPTMLILSLGMIGCAQQTQPSVTNHTPTVNLGQYTGYVTDFQAAGEAVGHPITVSDLIIRDNPGLAAIGRDGQCLMSDNTTPTIEINPTFWANATDDVRQIAIFHELGHCLLNLQHNNQRDSDGVPLHIMYFAADVFQAPALAEYYQANKTVYLNDLFGVE